METMARVAPSLHFASPRCSLRSTSFCSPSLASTNSFCASPICFKSSVHNQVSSLVLAKGRRRTGLRCSASNSSSAGSSERWILEPIGDGDFSHIGYKVARPGAFEIASSSVIVGRVPEKADVVLPVATVSGLHARLDKKDGMLLVTDLDSTNGTFVNEMKLRPGAVTPVPPGSILIFGDTNLAVFRVIKAEVESVTKAEVSESEPTSEPQAVSSKTTS
ncbi:zeaxanthin epoxidase [Carex littledalei]|uniref:Zeaxanthin epoxidase n=1 Tax=Carex littledalei TaxID=544730 RepID=A0A833QZF3_9POAL|nr:zeaxanthin epoxidase [Carex littledalei]